jgi:hypothetical protein
MKTAPRALLTSIMDTLFVFGLIIFIYVVGLSYFQPFWLSRQVFHFQEGVWWLSWLRNDVMGVIAFIMSIGGFFGSRYLRNRDEHPLE